jgi:putative transcriptional regulator
VASKVLRTVHETATDLFEAGVIDKATMREFDLLCLAPARERTPEAIRELRLRNRVSQPVFAAFLGVGKTAVQQWERGDKRPSGPALRLIEVVERHGLRALAGVPGEEAPEVRRA